MNANALLQHVLTLQHEHAIILLDEAARVTEWLPSASQVFGYCAGEMRGSTLERLFTPDDLARGDLDWELRAARSYGKAEDDRWLVRKDGLRIWASGVTTALYHPDGSLRGYSKILRDRTDLKGQIEALQARLETAARADHERHVVLGTLAHELRSPLGPLANAANLIRIAGADTPRIHAAAQIIERQVRFIEMLVCDLLETTRINLGKAQLHYAHVELRDIIDKALETCSAALKEREQEVEVLLPSALDLDADPIRLQQVLVNVIGNASKFSPPGNRIWIKGTVDGADLVLRVEDHGKGIPAELLPRIFDLFTQAQDEGGGANGGLGLGLQLVKTIVEMHRGTVQARSEGAGKGAEVIVRLPLQRMPEVGSAAYA